MKKFLALLLTGALVLGALSACGNTGSGADTKSPSAETPPAQMSNETEDTGIVYPVEIENDWGDGVTVIETEPNAIAVFDVGMLDILDTLGFGDRVVAVTHGVVIPDYLSEYEGDRYVSLGGFKDWDEEALSNSNPDLIFAGFRQTKGIEAVDAVAPAIYFGEDDEASYFEVLEKRVNAITALFGGEEKAQSYLAEIREKIAEIQEYTAGQEVTFLCVTVENGAMSNEGNNTSLLEEDLGLVNLNDNQMDGKGGGEGRGAGGGPGGSEGGQGGRDEATAGGGRTEGEPTEGQRGEAEEEEEEADNTAEVVALILEKNPTYLFVYDKDAAELEEGQPSAQEVIESAGLETSDAYQNGNIVYVDGATWYSASGGLVSTVELLDTIQDLFGLAG